MTLSTLQYQTQTLPNSALTSNDHTGVMPTGTDAAEAAQYDLLYGSGDDDLTGFRDDFGLN